MFMENVEDISRGFFGSLPKQTWFWKPFANTVPEAPASSIARSMQAVGTACPALVGRKASMLESNATRDVTSLLNKSGMAMKIPRHPLAPGFKSMDFFWGFGRQTQAVPGML